MDRQPPQMDRSLLGVPSCGISDLLYLSVYCFCYLLQYSFLNVFGSFFETVRLNLERSQFPDIAHDQSFR